MASWTTTKTWNIGDVLTAADMNTYVRDNVQYLYDNGYRFIQRNSGAAATYIFTVPSGYTDLRLTWKLRTASTNAFDSAQVTLNGVSTGYYQEYEYEDKNPSFAQHGDEGNNSSQWSFLSIPGVSTGAWGVGTMDIIGGGAAGLSHAMTAIFYAANNNNSAAGNQRIGKTGGWQSTITAAITQISVQPSAGNFIAGSSASLYGSV